MAHLVQLSDLHLLANPVEQAGIFDALVAALHAHYAGRARRADLLAITGDVFDTATVEPREATRHLVGLLDRIREALGGEVPTVVIPGNHDRRQNGLVGPHRPELFVAVREALGSAAWVHGCRTPFLADVVAPSVHRLPLALVAYDSTYLPKGLLGAGGLMRQEDLLRAAALVDDAPPDWPVLFLLHHHLVADAAHRPRAHRSGAHAPARAVGPRARAARAHHARRSRGADHDGARRGDRALDAPHARAGRARAARAQALRHRAALARDGPRPRRRARGVGRQRGHRGALEPHGERRRGEVVAVVQRDRARGRPARHRRRLVRLQGLVRGEGRAPRPRPRAAPGRHVEHRSRPRRATAARPRDAPARVELALDATTRYRHTGGLCRTVAEDVRVHGPGAAPFEWLSLMNRYETGLARLAVHGLGPRAREAFASATDLGTGLETPMRLRRDIDAGTVELWHPDCAPRTLLRVYWPLHD